MVWFFFFLIKAKYLWDCQDPTGKRVGIFFAQNWCPQHGWNWWAPRLQPGLPRGRGMMAKWTQLPACWENPQVHGSPIQRGKSRFRETPELQKHEQRGSKAHPPLWGAGSLPERKKLIPAVGKSLCKLLTSPAHFLPSAPKTWLFASSLFR